MTGVVDSVNCEDDGETALRQYSARRLPVVKVDGEFDGEHGGEKNKSIRPWCLHFNATS